MPSAMMMQPSLADWTMTPWIRSSSRIVELSSANMVEPPDIAPPVRQAFSLTWNLSSSVSRPALMALKTTSMVISLASEAGGIELVGVLGKQDRAGLGVDHEGLGGLGLEELRRRPAAECLTSSNSRPASAGRTADETTDEITGFDAPRRLLLQAKLAGAADVINRHRSDEPRPDAGQSRTVMRVGRAMRPGRFAASRRCRAARRDRR